MELGELFEGRKITKVVIGRESNVGMRVFNLFNKYAVVDGCWWEAIISKNSNVKKIPRSNCIFLALDVSKGLKYVVFVVTL